MEDQRAQTLEALAAFIENQRTFLSRTQADIGRLRDLKSRAISEPNVLLSDLSVELNNSAFNISNYEGCQPGPPTGIDWSLYAQHDPQPFHSLTRLSRTSYEQRNHPQPRPQPAEPSDLSSFIQAARRAILDPILDNLEPSSESETENVEKERGCRTRKDSCGLTAPRPRGRGGLFVKQVDDMDVDVPRSDDLISVAPMDVDIPLPSRPPPVKKSARSRRPAPKILARIEDENRIRARIHDQSIIITIPARKPKPVVAVAREVEPPGEDVMMVSPLQETQSVDENIRPKSDTFKQAWTMSEQHLLEQLLVQYPEETRNRWSQISKAMNGRRTARQVASRVQKYIEKLKRFNVGGQ
ncbi:hypothetical protein C8J56DRAFT_959500 [Mycena floridula]|nr:hypothetical protein C8J56DRAFT_959500 [Mycena floridula]